MFVMMNEARLGVGMEGIALSGNQLPVCCGLCQEPTAKSITQPCTE